MGSYQDGADEMIRVARIVPGGLHWSYRQLFDTNEAHKDSVSFSAERERLGIVLDVDTGGMFPQVVDAYLAPVRLRLFPQQDRDEGLRAPRSLWRSLSRQLKYIDGSHAGAAQAVLRDIVDHYAANVLGKQGAAAPYLLPGSRFASDYASNATIPLLRERLRGHYVPSVASRVGAVQFARAIDKKPLIEREGIVDLVSYLNERAQHGHSRRHDSGYGRRGVA
jgi:hypothetical protein